MDRLEEALMETLMTRNGINSSDSTDEYSEDKSTLKVAYLGAGTVGAISAIVMAWKCPDINVSVLDVSEKAISSYKLGGLKFYEPKLEEILKEVKDKNIRFSTSIEYELRDSDVVFICVNTPTMSEGIGKDCSPDMSQVENAARSIRTSCKKRSVIVVNKSTVPVKYGEKIRQLLEADEGNDYKTAFEVISNPEFLSAGNAINDMLYPDRILIGGSGSYESRKAMGKIRGIYMKWIPSEKILLTDMWSSELSKLVANAFLAQRVTSINSISAICEAAGGDIREISKSIGLDTRIGEKFLQPSIGFGGGCFKKDILCLCYISESLGLLEVSRYWNEVLEINYFQLERFFRTIVLKMFDTVKKKTIILFGASFKKNTSTVRGSLGIDLGALLIREGANIAYFDPKADETEVREELKRSLEKLGVFEDCYTVECCTLSCSIPKQAHAIVICTDWEEFKEFDYEKAYKKMEKPAFIFDGRLILDHSYLKNIGFNVFAMGVNKYLNR